MRGRGFILRTRRKAVKAVAGRELVKNAEDTHNLDARLDELTNKINVLQQQINDNQYATEYSLTKYMHPDMYEEYLKDKYYRNFNKELDFNNLQTFTEKIQWLNLYGSDDLQTQLADKYLVKEYITQQIGEKYVVPLLGVYDSFDEIDFDTLPARFVVKTNNGSGANIIVKDKDVLDLDVVRRQLNSWLPRNQFVYSLELYYKNIKPRIIIEKYLEFERGIEDYKFYCFNGKPEYLLVIADRLTDEKMAFYDMKFKKQHFSILPGMKDLDVKKPEQFNEMLRLTKKLIKKLNYPVVRVDWYIDKKGSLFFGEFTFNPGGGYYFFVPEKYDKVWGDKITLPLAQNKKQL